MSVNPETGLLEVGDEPVCSICGVESQPDVFFPWFEGVVLCDTCLGLSSECVDKGARCSIFQIAYAKDLSGWVCTDCGLTYRCRHMPEGMEGVAPSVVVRAMAYQHSFGWDIGVLRTSMPWAAQDLEVKEVRRVMAVDGQRRRPGTVVLAAGGLGALVGAVVATVALRAGR